MLREAGGYLGSLASADLAARCTEGSLDAGQRARSRRARKRELTAKSSSRWAGALTRTSEDAYQLACRNLLAERLPLAGLPAGTRDGRLRAAITRILATARQHRAGAVVIENLDFAAARDQGREHAGRRPCRGRRGRAFRYQVAGLPTARFRDRLTGMASNTGIAVLTVDPAYTSRWGREHWLARPAAAPPRAHRPPRGSAGDRQTRTRPAGPAACVREPTRTRGCGTVHPGTPRDPPQDRDPNQETRHPDGPTAATRHQDRKAPTEHGRRPGDPRPSGAARQAGPAPAR